MSEMCTPNKCIQYVQVQKWANKPLKMLILKSYGFQKKLCINNNFYDISQHTKKKTKLFICVITSLHDDNQNKQHAQADTFLAQRPIKRQ